MDFKTLYRQNAQIYYDQEKAAQESYKAERARILKERQRKQEEAAQVDREMKEAEERNKKEAELKAKQQQKEEELAQKQQEEAEEKEAKKAAAEKRPQQPKSLQKNSTYGLFKSNKSLLSDWHDNIQKFVKQSDLQKKRRQTTPGRIANLMEDALNYEQAAKDVEKVDPKAAEQLRAQRRDIINKINKEVEWYASTDPTGKSAEDEAPDGYFTNAFSVPLDAIVSLFRSDKRNKEVYEKTKNNLWQDVYHTWGISKNQVQMQTSLGKIETLDQQMNLASQKSLDDYQKTCEDYIKFKTSYDDIMNRYVSGKGVSKEEYKALDGLKAKYTELGNKKNDYEKRFKDLSTFEAPYGAGWLSNVQSSLNKANLDFGTGVGGSLQGFSNNILEFQKALSKGDKTSAEKYKKELNGVFQKFNTKAKQMRELWQKDYEIDRNDLKRYTEDGYKVTDYYKQKEQAAQTLAWYSPSKMWMAASLLGSSMSSPEKTAMSMGAGLVALGGAALAGPSGGSSIALTAGAASFLAGMAAGADENFANVADATDVIAKKDLEDRGLSAAFLADAKKILGENTDVDEALHAFYAGKYVPSNVKVRQTLLDATAGAAKQYYQGMGVNTWDSLVDAIVTCMPMGSAAKTTKVGFLLDKAAAKADKRIVYGASKAALKKKIAAYMQENNVSITEAVKAMRGKTGPVSSALAKTKSVLNAPADYVRTLTKQAAEDLGLPILKTKAVGAWEGLVDKGLAKMAERSLKHTANVAEMAEAIPGRVLRYRSVLNTVGKGIKDFGWRVGASMYSEGAEEGLQQLQQYQRIEERSNQFYNVVNQLPLTVIDGAKLWASFLFKDPSKATAQERDIWEQMHGGILGSLLQGMPTVAVQTGVGTYRQYSLHQMVMNNLLADHISDTDYLAKAAIMSQEIKKGNYKNLISTINYYDQVTSDMKERHKDDANWALPGNHVENLKNLTNTVARLQANKDVQNTAKAAGFLQDETKGVKESVKRFINEHKNKKARTERKQRDTNYNSYIAILAGRLNDINDSREFYDEKAKELIGARMDNSGTFEDFMRSNTDPTVSQLLTKIEKNDEGEWVLDEKHKDDDALKQQLAQLKDDYTNRNDFSEMLHGLIAYMRTNQLLSDMEAIKNLKGGESLSSRAKFEVDRIKKYLHKKYGDNINLDTEDDIKNFAKAHGINIDDDYVDAVKQVKDAALQLNFHNEMYNKLLSDSKFAKSSVESYLENKKEDELLRQSIEDDFTNNELDRQKRLNTNITADTAMYTRNGKTYFVGNDGYGNPSLYEYDDESGAFVQSQRAYDFDEWYDSRQDYDDYTKSRQTLKSQYDDYQDLINKNEDDLTEEEKKRLDMYKTTMLDKFNQYEKDEEENGRISRELGHAEEIGTKGASKAFSHFQQYLRDKGFRKKTALRHQQALLLDNFDGISRARILQIEALINSGKKPKYKRTAGGTKYSIGSHIISTEEYQYAKWYAANRDTVQDDYDDSQLNPSPAPATPPAPPAAPTAPSAPAAPAAPAAPSGPAAPAAPATPPATPPGTPPSERKQYHGKDITEEQANVLTSLDDYKASLPKYHYEWRTGATYFIEENGVITAHKRLHSLLAPQFEDKPNIKEAKKRVTQRLLAKRDAWLNAIDGNKSSNEIESLKQAYIDELQAVRNEFLGIVERLYGRDSRQYQSAASNKVDGYLSTEAILKSDDTIDAFAEMFRHDGDDVDLVGGSVVAGTIVDGICRDIMNHANLQYNEQEHQMPEDVFNKLVENITRWRDTMETTGYALVTDPLCWHSELHDNDGKSVGFVAGETDMLVIAPDGTVSIIDFKTAKYSWETQQRQTGVQFDPSTRENIASFEDYIEALDKRYNPRYEFGARQKHTSREHYTSQINAYKQMVVNCTGANVTHLQLMGFQVTSIRGTGDFTMFYGILDVLPLTMIDMAITDPVFASTSYVVPRQDVENHLTEAKERCREKTNRIQERIKTTKQLIINAKLEDDAPLALQINKVIEAFEKLDASFVDNIGTVDFANQHEAHLDNLKTWLDEKDEELRTIIAKNIEEQHKQEGPAADPSKFKAPHRIHDSSLISQYNHTAPIQSSILEDVRRDLELFKNWTTEPDFLEHVQFEVDFSNENRRDHFIKGVSAPKHLRFKSITYKGHSLCKGAVQSIIFYWAIGQGNVSLRDKLLECFNQNYEDLVSGKKKVILKGLSRTNGVLQYNNPLTNVLEALNLDDDALGNLYNYNDSSKAVVLISDRMGVLRRLDSKDGKVGSGTAERTAPDTRNANRPGVVFIQKPLGYTEDEGADYKPHTALIALTPMKMSESAANLIISILSEQRQSTKAKALDQDGNEVEGPIDSTVLLHNIIRFGKGAEYTQNNFQFNYVITDGRVNYKQVYISNDGGKTKQIFSLTNNDDINRLRQFLLKDGYLNVQDTSILRDCMNTSKTGGLFAGLKQWFDKHPDVQSLKYSDEVVFTREDVSMNRWGIEWMIKNNWMKSEYSGISNAVVAADDFEIVDTTETPEQTATLIKEELKLINDQMPTSPQEGPTTGPAEEQGTGTNDDSNDSYDDTIAAYNEYGFGNDLGVDDGLFMHQDRAVEHPIQSEQDMQKAVEDVKRICGDSVLVEIAPGVIARSAEGDVVGVCTAAGIQLSYGAENGVQFHEAFHRIVELVMPTKQRQKMYNWYTKKYGKGKTLSERDIAEGLADMYFEYGRKSWHPKGFLAKMFARIYNYINALIRTKSFGMATTFHRIDYGKYANRKVSEKSKKSFHERFGQGLNMTVLDKEGKSRELTHVYTHAQLNDAIESLVPRIVKAQGIDVLGKNIKNLMTSKSDLIDKDSPFYKEYKALTMPGKTEKLLNEDVEKGLISPLVRNNILIMRDVFDNWDIAHPMIEAKMRSFGIQIREDKEQEKKEAQDAGEQSAVSSDIEGHADEFYTHSLSDDVAAPIVYRLSTLMNVRYVTPEDVAAGLAPGLYMTNAKGEVIMDHGAPKRRVIPVKRNSLGMPTYMSFKAVHQKLLSELHDVKDVEDMYNRLVELGKTDYVFEQIAQTLNALRNQSYLRMTSKKDFGDYVGWPIVKYGNSILKPEYYIADPKVHTEGYKYPQVVRLVKPLKTKDGKTYKAGDILPGAVYALNQNILSLTTLLFQATKSQKLNFKFLRIRPAKDPNGNVINGKYNYAYENTNTDQSSSQFPVQWFDNVRQGLTGNLYNPDGSVNRNYDGFEKAGALLTNVMIALTNRNGTTMMLNGKKYNLSNIEDFDTLVGMVVTTFNNLGVMITKPVLYHMLHKMNPTSSDYVDSFVEIMTASKQKALSIYSLVSKGGVLDTLNQAVKAGNLAMFTKDEAVGKGGNAKYSGAYLYQRNSFITRLAIEVGSYRTATSEMMTIGAGNTKMYMYAQNNTVSDIVEDMNNCLNEDGSVKEGSILADMQNVVYCNSEWEGVKCGSIILKQLQDPERNKKHNKYEVFTEAGSKMSSSQDGSVKFSEMAKREDYISRMEKLSRGYIIMPTLSDKSTYMCISGFEMPGFNYSATSLADFGMLPVFSAKFGHMAFDMADTSRRDVLNNAGPVINQFMQYFFMEFNNVEKTMRELGIIGDGKDKLKPEELVENYHTKNKTGARFTSLTGVYVMEKQGDKEVEVFKPFNLKSDDGTDGILEGYNNAVKYFFSKSYEELAAMVARILQKRLDKELQSLVDAGIITTAVTDKSGRLNSKYYNFGNKYLSNDKIRMIADMYANTDVTTSKGVKKLSELRNPLQLESMAVVAYAYDCMCKLLMSMEESRRFFTGMPQFFKTGYSDNGTFETFGVDETKRYGGLGSTGTNNREDIPGIPEEYTCAEINDWEVPSAVQDSLRESFRTSEYKEAVVNIKLSEDESLTQAEKTDIYNAVYSMTEDELKKILEEKGILSVIDAKVEASAKSYGSVNITDGTAFITDKMAENLLKQRGVFTSEVEKAFETLRGKSDYYLSNSKAYSIIHNALISTQKYSAFGYRMQNGIPVHFYDKFALFPVFKGIAYGFMQNLYEKMNDKENGVDMVMMHSAVKAGSQAAQDFNPDMKVEDIASFSFKGHTYKQKYKWIRRQLNTDPRTEEIMSAGTQALKIAMSTLRDGQTYNVRTQNGVVKMSAEAVRDKIMNTMNKLADLGWNDLTKEFLNQDGSVNLQNLQKFLINLLASRNADKNLTDALQLTPDGKAFQVDLNTVSNMAWVESILTSEVNKRVIDVTAKGNAFYQRTVFGMDSPYTRVGEENLASSINNGKPLQMVNEEGSMDAVVSIDYFMDIIPRHLRNNFKKAKQFLIDNNVISGVKTGETEWHNAEANTMSYRIPTQAASSIGALRFVDVLPIVRDTIVLPKEFTAQTGSDFDIDKLYMSTLHFEKNEFEEEYTDGEGQTQKRKSFTLSLDNIKDEKNGLTNELLHTYLSLLKDAGSLQDGKISGGNYSHILRRSIDNDTKLVTSVLSELESRTKKKQYEPYEFEVLSSQVDTRASFATGKTGIGPFALNNNNQILTLIYGVDFIDDGGILSNLGRLKLSNTTDVDGNSILSWISAMINAHVDVAKDPYIMRLNINKATYNLANLLIRTGFGRHGLYFLNNPIVKGLALVYNECDGQIVDDPGKSPSQRKNEAEVKYIENKLGKESFASMYASATPADKRKFAHDSMRHIQALFGPAFGGVTVKLKGKDGKYDVDTGMSAILYFAINPDRAFLSTTSPDADSVSIGNTLYTVNDIQGYLYIATKEFETYAEGLSKLVQYTKIDTKKQGINFNDQRDYVQGYDDMKHAGLFNENLRKLLEESYIETKTQYGTQFVGMILGDKMIHMTDRFRYECLDILEKLNNRTKATKQAVQNAMLCYIKQKCFNKAFEDYIQKYNEEHGTQHTVQSYWMSLITGPNTLAKRIKKVQMMIQNDTKGVLKEFGQNGVITNEILARLYNVSYMSTPGITHYDIISMTNTTEDDSSTQNDFIDAWEQMLDYSNDKNPKLQEAFRKLANDLAIYAFMSSADSKGFTKFFKYVPLSWRKSFGYDKYMHQAFDEYSGYGVSVDSETTNRFGIDFDDFMQNFAYDNKILPELRTKTQTGNKRFIEASFIYNTVTYDGTLIQGSEARNIVGLTLYKGKYTCPISKNTRGEFPEYVKVRRTIARQSDQDKFLLYKLVDTGVVKNGDACIEYPIYQVIDSKGVQLRIGAQQYQFYACGMDSSYDRILFSRKGKDGQWGYAAPTVEKVMEAYAKRRDKLQDAINRPGISLKQAIKESGFLSSRDYNANITDLLAAAFGGLVTESDAVNINYGRGENPLLSNFADRHISDVFKYLPTLVKQRISGISELQHDAPRVENAFQAIKVFYSHTLTDASGNLTSEGRVVFDSIMNSPNGKVARARGRKIQDLDVSQWNEVSQDVLYALMLQSFKENEDARAALKLTLGKKLTHLNKNGEILDKKGKEGEEYSPFIQNLAAIREQLFTDHPFDWDNTGANHNLDSSLDDLADDIEQRCKH